MPDLPISVDLPAAIPQKAPDNRRTRAMTTGFFFEDLQIGQTASLGKTITEADILLYAAVSTDTNPVHIDAEAAKQSIFGERIAHGMLSAGLISAVLGTRLPGAGTLYMRQSLRFTAPVKIGDTVKATATVTALSADKKRATLSTVCTVGDEVVIDGEAYVQVPSRS
jgi:3-hydroxybutyryl-CoA dehydratase